MSRVGCREAVLAALVCAASVGCAAKQRIPLDCIPEGASLYLDGERLEAVPAELTLKANEPHTLFLKGEDMVPELVVLESAKVDGKARLSPESICLRPRAAAMRQELSVAIDPEASSEAPPGSLEESSTVDVEPRPAFDPGAP